MKIIAKLGLLAGLSFFSAVAVAAEMPSVRGYAGIGASRFTFEEEGARDVEPLSASVFTGLELHRFLDVQMQLSIPVKEDKYSEPMALVLHDYLGRNFAITSTGAVSVKTELPLNAAFYIKPKLDVGPVQLYVLGGVAYTHLEQELNGTFDGAVTASDGTPLGSFSGLAWEIQRERESVSLAYGAGVALNLGRLRLHGEYVRLDKRDATNHSCHTTGYVGAKAIVYCDDLFGSSVLDSATAGLAISF